MPHCRNEGRLASLFNCCKENRESDILASPGVSSSVGRLGRGRGLEFADVESGGVASRHDGSAARLRVG